MRNPVFNTKQITAKAPKVIKIYLNRFDLDFDNVEDQPLAQTIVLDEEYYLSKDREIEFLTPQFQHVESLAMFVESNLQEEDSSVLHYVQLIGRRA